MTASLTHIPTLAKVRFVNPVTAGSRLCAQIGLKCTPRPTTVVVRPPRGFSKVGKQHLLTAYEPIAGGAQLTMTVTIERDGSDKPACVAETVSCCFT